MADGGIGEAALLSAAIGGGMSAIQGRDPLQGMIMGGLLGGAGSGIFGGAEGLAGNAGEAVAADTAAMAQQQAAINAGQSVEASQLAGINSLPGAQPSFVSRGGVDVFNGAEGATNNRAGQSYINQMAANNAALYTDAPATGFGGPGTFEIVSPSAGQAITAAGPSATPSFLDTAGSYLPETTAGKIALGGGLGLAGLMAQDRNKYGVPATEKYTGPLSKFSYNPSTYQPDIVRPPNPVYRAQYAAGGPVEQMSNANAIGANTSFPQAYLHNAAYATPYQTPISQNVLTGDGDVSVDPYTGEPNMQGTGLAEGGSVRHYDIMDDPRFKTRMEAILQGKPVPQYASGGISSLGSYSDGGRMLKGPGDGMSDDIPAKIGGKQEARLADGEFVVPADVVSHLGNGSTDAGAKQLYSMMDKVRQARTGRKSQGSQIKPNKYMPA